VTILNTIGRTRLVPLRHIVPEGSARILIKLEYENPTGSMKDRMALAMVEAAEADGIDSGSDGDNPAPRSSRRYLCRHFHRWKRGRGVAGRRTPGA